MAHIKRRMTPLYLLDEEKKRLDKFAKKRGISRQKILEEIIKSGVDELGQISDENEIREERRKERKRLKTKLQVYFGPSSELVLSGFSVDISAGGLFIQTTYPFQVNDKLQLIFTLPGHEKSINCEARVAWTNSEHSRQIPELPPGIGLGFVDLSLEDVMSISKFIEESDIEGVW